MIQPGNASRGLAEGEIGYVLKSYPRMSETFIANEIYLLEKLGLRLRLFSILDLSDPQRHAVVDATRAPVDYLPQVTPLTDALLGAGLRRVSSKNFYRRAPLRSACWLQARFAICTRISATRRRRWPCSPAGLAAFHSASPRMPKIF